MVLGPDSFTSFYGFNGQVPLSSTAPVNSKLATFFGIVISHRNFICFIHFGIGKSLDHNSR